MSQAIALPTVSQNRGQAVDQHASCKGPKKCSDGLTPLSEETGKLEFANLIDSNTLDQPKRLFSRVDNGPKPASAWAESPAEDVLGDADAAPDGSGPDVLLSANGVNPKPEQSTNIPAVPLLDLTAEAPKAPSLPSRSITVSIRNAAAGDRVQVERIDAYEGNQQTAPDVSVADQFDVPDHASQPMEKPAPVTAGVAASVVRDIAGATDVQASPATSTPESAPQRSVLSPPAGTAIANPSAVNRMRVAMQVNDEQLLLDIFARRDQVRVRIAGLDSNISNGVKIDENSIKEILVRHGFNLQALRLETSETADTAFNTNAQSGNGQSGNGQTSVSNGENRHQQPDGFSRPGGQAHNEPAKRHAVSAGRDTHGSAGGRRSGDIYL